MSSAKWQRHSTFLSVRWRTWIGRVVGVSGKRGGGLADLWHRVKPGCQHRPTGGGTPTERRRAFQSATGLRPVSYQAARGLHKTATSATAADGDTCEVVVVVVDDDGVT